MNVQAGDIARIIRDDSFPSNVGALVLVVRRVWPRPEVVEYRTASGVTYPPTEPVWDCEALQHIRGYKNSRNASEVELFPPGRIILIFDAWLKKEPPPEEPTGDIIVLSEKIDG